MKTEVLGQLAAVSGVVVRTSEVRPELLYGTFRCLECGSIQRHVEQQFKYTQVGREGGREVGGRGRGEPHGLKEI